MATGHNETDTPEAQFLAHQLMQPVTAADNYAAALLELLHGGRLTPEKLEEGLAKIKSQTEKALGTAKALRALTRAQTTAAGRALFQRRLRRGLPACRPFFRPFPVRPKAFAVRTLSATRSFWKSSFLIC